MEDLYFIHEKMLQGVPAKRRDAITKINWDNNALCLFGPRGSGKTTLLLQRIIDSGFSIPEVLYISADNIIVINKGLYNIAKEFFRYGGKLLVIDEIHKYPQWSLEIKNIIDIYKDKKIVFSGSSSIEILKGKADLSRRVIFYPVNGLSFREFLFLSDDYYIPSISLEDILSKSISLSLKIQKEIPVLKLFSEYLEHGYYPFYFDDPQGYFLRLNNVIEKVIYEDIGVLFNLKMTNIPVLKKILFLVSSSNPFTPNFSRISKELEISREFVHNYFEYLSRAGLISFLSEDLKSLRMVRKAQKAYIDNTNLLYAINNSYNIENNTGNIRETFFFNQLSKGYSIFSDKKADFIVDGKYIFEIGGRNKKESQIKNINNAFIAMDNIEIASKNVIPLWLFGFLY